MSSISPRSLSVFNLMALYASQKKPEIWVRQETFAEKLKCSTDTVYRAIKELVNFGLVAELERMYLGRYKTYRLKRFLEDTAAEAQNTDAMRISAPTYRKDAVPRTARVREDVPQICGPINRVSITEHKTEHFFSERTQDPIVGEKSELELLLQTYGEEWKKKFPCLDGLSGRPSLKECVEQGLAHKARKNYGDVKVALDTWLRNASRQWIFLYNKEQNASPTDSALDSEAQKRRAEAERLNQLELAQKKTENARKRQEEAEQIKNTQQPQTTTETPETEEERAWIIARIKADNEAEQRKA
ncbi:MAG: helix-turn-helix domain-containing protein, partial [Verrucomicrobiota bacterium]